MKDRLVNMMLTSGHATTTPAHVVYHMRDLDDFADEIVELLLAIEAEEPCNCGYRVCPKCGKDWDR